MKKIFITLITLILFNSAAESKIYAYYPNGKKISFEYNCIRDILDSLNGGDTELYLDGSASKGYNSIYLKKLTTIPVLYVLDKPTPNIIPQLLSKYKIEYNKYLYSYSYYYDIQQLKDSGMLSRTYIYDKFGNPNATIHNDDSTKTLIWKNKNLKVVFNGDMIESFDVVNYNAIEKNNFAISGYKVTGDDYSIGFDITVLNRHPKTVKYVYFTVKATNSVKDLVSVKVVTGVGPIPKGETASYEFKNIIYLTTADHLNLQSIKLKFMDGTIKIIPKSVIDNITMKDWGNP